MPRSGSKRSLLECDRDDGSSCDCDEEHTDVDAVAVVVGGQIESQSIMAQSEDICEGEGSGDAPLSTITGSTEPLESKPDGRGGDANNDDDDIMANTAMSAGHEKDGQSTTHHSKGTVTGDASASSTCAATKVTNVLDTIGIEVYKFLHPKDLLSFSLTNHHVHDEVSKGLIQACMRQLPPGFGSRGVDHCISFHNRHSYPEKKKLLDHLLEKIKTAELKLVGTEDLSMEDSLSKAREALTNKKGAKFVSRNTNLPAHLSTEYTSAGYHHDPNNKVLSASRCKYILSRMELQEQEEEGESSISSSSSSGRHYLHLPAVRMWIEYILAQRHVVVGTWFWSCRHRNLDFQGVEGKGVMISSPEAEGEEIEICWTRLTASRV